MLAALMKRDPRAERREATVEKIVSGGSGLVRLDASREVVLVPRVAPGERIEIEIDRSRRPARGRVLSVLEPSKSRVDARCAALDRCGGCDLMHLDRDAQRDARLAILREVLALEGDAVIAWHDATPPQGRTRARWHAKGLGDGRLVLGYHAAGSRTIVDLARCPILDPRLEAALDDARAIAEGARGEGEIHAALGHGGRPVLSFEWKGELPMHAYAEAERRVGAGRVAGVEIALAGAKVPARIGDPRPIAVAADGLPMVSPPRGFAQASEIGDRVLVDVVRARSAASGRKVAELFAGSGNFTVALAADAAHVTAVELVPAACDAARENAKARGLANVKVVNADADAWPIPKDVEVVVLDPPRTGARGAAQAIVDRKVRRVVYVACEPTTLARDLATLRAGGYGIEAVDAIDLFPDTSHVETVVTLVRSR